MSKITLNNVTNLLDSTTAQTTINNNSATIQTAFDNTLSRDGTSPNQMSANIDMSSNRILNLPAAVSGLEPVRLQDVVIGSFTVNPSLVGDVTATAAVGPLTTTLAKIQGTAVTGTTGAGKVVLATSPIISGVSTNSNAGPGVIGEYVTASGSASPATGVTADIASISLTAGDWEVSASIATNTGGNITGGSAWLNTASATDPSFPNDGCYINLPTTSGRNVFQFVGTRRFSLSGTTTVFASTSVTWTTSNTSTMFIRARRVR